MHLSRLVASVALLTACRSNAPSAPPSANEDFPIPEHYEAPPAPCALVEDSGPTLAMPWRGGAQTFLEAGTVRDSLALDYDVWPRPHVDRVRVGLDFDRVVSDEVLTLDGVCPRVLDLAPLRAIVSAAAPGDVARVVVIAEDDERSRRGELFFTTGTRTLRVAVDEALPTEHASLLLFEPAWGEPRVALRVVEPGEEGPWTLDGLPEGPATLAWVALEEAPLHDVESGVVYLPGGFAQDWVAFASAFRARPITRTDDPETLVMLDVGTNDFDHADSNDDIVWEGARDRVLVTADASNLELPMDVEEGTPPDALPHAQVTVPCAPFELATLSTSEVFVTLEDQPEVAVGDRASLRPTCTEGSTTVSIRVRSRNARDTRILFRATTSDSTPAE